MSLPHRASTATKKALSKLVIPERLSKSCRQAMDDWEFFFVPKVRVGYAFTYDPLLPQVLGRAKNDKNPNGVRKYRMREAYFKYGQRFYPIPKELPLGPRTKVEAIRLALYHWQSVDVLRRKHTLIRSSGGVLDHSQPVDNFAETPTITAGTGESVSGMAPVPTETLSETWSNSSQHHRETPSVTFEEGRTESTIVTVDTAAEESVAGVQESHSTLTEAPSIQPESMSLPTSQPPGAEHELEDSNGDSDIIYKETPTTYSAWGESLTHANSSGSGAGLEHQSLTHTYDDGVGRPDAVPPPKELDYGAQGLLPPGTDEYTRAAVDLWSFVYDTDSYHLDHAIEYQIIRAAWWRATVRYSMESELLPPSHTLNSRHARSSSTAIAARRRHSRMPLILNYLSHFSTNLNVTRTPINLRKARAVERSLKAISGPIVTLARAGDVIDNKQLHHLSDGSDLDAEMEKNLEIYTTAWMAWLNNLLRPGKHDPSRRLASASIADKAKKLSPHANRHAHRQHARFLGKNDPPPPGFISFRTAFLQEARSAGDAEPEQFAQGNSQVTLNHIQAKMQSALSDMLSGLSNCLVQERMADDPMCVLFEEELARIGNWLLRWEPTDPLAAVATESQEYLRDLDVDME
eukprot:Clim_evm102s147 gene=Clim_evmTU102s147